MILTIIQQEKIRKEFKLSNREMDVIKAILSGKDTDIEIAKSLHLTLMTTKQYIQRIYYKTGKRKKLSAVLKCLEILDLH